MNLKFNKKEYFLPFILTILTFVLDQVSKIWIVKNVEPYQIYKSFCDGLVNIILVFNKGAAFSMGSAFNETLRFFILGVLPLLALVFLVVFYFRTNDLSYAQRWWLAGILGGGLGNILDRFIRPDGVVDFIDVKFFGLLGFERWPTFNIADSTVVVCGIALIITLVITEIKTKANNN